MANVDGTEILQMKRAMTDIHVNMQFQIVIHGREGLHVSRNYTSPFVTVQNMYPSVGN